MRRSCHVAMVLAAVWLAGCASLPEYRPAPGAPAARLNMQGVGDKLLCVDGALYKPANDGDGYAPIPAGRRVKISVYYNEQRNNVVFRCDARVSLVPAAGQKYLVDFEPHTERCYLTVLKEDASKRAGVSVEPTLAAASACKAP